MINDPIIVTSCAKQMNFKSAKAIKMCKFKKKNGNLTSSRSRQQFLFSTHTRALHLVCVCVCAIHICECISCFYCLTEEEKKSTIVIRMCSLMRTIVKKSIGFRAPVYRLSVGSCKICDDHFSNDLCADIIHDVDEHYLMCQ